MKVCVCIIVIVIQIITCEKAIKKLQRKLIAPKMNENCKNIKCPTVEDPQCVRMRRHDLSLTFHMIVANKCELEYLKCHDDVEGKIVPLKFCGQQAVLTAKQQKNEKGTAHSRPKRAAILSEPPAESKMRIKALEQEISKDHKIKDPKINRKRGRKSHLQALKRMQRKLETKDHTQMLRRNNTRAHGRMQRKNQIKGLGKHARQYTGCSSCQVPYEEPPIDHSFESRRPKPRYYNKKPLQAHIGDKKRARPNFPLFSEETVNNYGKTENPGAIDNEQYVAACPTVCPSQDVMVCAMCQHRIYRTFSSDCHLRMYGCKNPKEKMQLVSRVPCVQSSPFLSEPGLQPQGRIAGPAHDDVVLQFIKCRDKGLLGTSEDPRCNFDPAKDFMMFPGKPLLSYEDENSS